MNNNNARGFQAHTYGEIHGHCSSTPRRTSSKTAL